MDTYNKGQWGKDDEYKDDDVHLRDNKLICDGFDDFPEITMGDEYGFSVKIFGAKDVDSKYTFFAVIDTGNRSFWYLVTDFPSVLMLIKEVLPIIAAMREQEAHEVLMEEHEWKVKRVEPTRNQCAHIA